MSEEERKKRFSYRVKRKRLITLMSSVLILLLVATLFTGIFAYIKDNTYYVNYSEKSAIDYGVFLKENDFYENSYLGKDYAYIASLIDKVHAEFDYEIKMDSKEAVNFNYNYRVDAVVQIKNKNSNKVLFAPVYNEIEEKSYTVTGNSVKINDIASVDYAKYNDIAEKFIKTYNLEMVDASLLLQMHVNVTGRSDEFLNDKSSNSYTASVSIPLASNTAEVKITSAIPAEEQKILSYTTKDVSEKFLTACKILAIISALFAVALWIYAYLSRNIDVTYDIKIAKLVRSYKSFIQKLCNSFNEEGYQVLLISTFDEMLEIRDTIQSPILMEENADRTYTRFFIPTNTKILYVHEIKVDDYDDIYNKSTESDPQKKDADNTPIITYVNHAEASSEQEVTDTVKNTNEDAVTEPEEEAEEPTEEAEEEVTEAPATNTIPAYADIIECISENDEEDGPSSIAYIDENGRRIEISCNRSFTANLIQSNPQVKAYYSSLKNYILSHKGVKARISWRMESYNKGRTPLFKMKIRGKSIVLYCALNPNEFNQSRYFQNEATAKIFSAVPMMVKVRSDRGLNRAKELVDAVIKRFEIQTAKKPIAVDYPQNYPYESTKQLVERGLIKILIPGAELKEPKTQHHEKTVSVENDDVVDELTIFDEELVTEEEINEVIEAPTVTIEQIDYDDSSESSEGFVASEENPGVDVIGVVWPERPQKNKIYRYDPDGHNVEVGDVVVVPTRDSSRNRDVVRKAVVAHDNHKVDSKALSHPLKKILGVFKRKTK